MTWLAAEATRDSKLLLIRSRDPVTSAPKRSFTELLVVEQRYQRADETFLPSEPVYRELEMFEALTLDRLEDEGCLILVLVETGAGTVRHFCYTADVASAVDRIIELSGLEDKLEFSSAHDPSWRQFEVRAPRRAID